MKRIRLGVFLILLTVFMAGLACVSTMAEDATAEDSVEILEGVYRLKVVDEERYLKTPYLYYSPKLSKDRQCQFQARKDYGEYDPETFYNNPDIDKSQLWLIKKCEDYYLIYNYEGYVEGSKSNKLLRCPHLDDPKYYYFMYCEAATADPNKQDFCAKFYDYDRDEYGNHKYIRLGTHPEWYLGVNFFLNLTEPDIWFLLTSDFPIFVQGYTAWELDPFVLFTIRYEKNGKKFSQSNVLLDGGWKITRKIPKLSKNQEFLGWRLKGGDDTLYQPGQEMPGRRENATFEAVIQTVTKVGTAVPAPSLKATKKGKITVDWNLFFRKMKYRAIWKKAKYIEIEYSTDKRFQTIDGIKIIKKGTIKKNPKSTISKLKSNKTYYVRARLWDGNTVFSKWSKTVKIKSK